MYFIDCCNENCEAFVFFCSVYRLNSYKCITDTLQELVNQSKAAPQSPSVPKKPGPPVLSSDPNMLSNEEAGHHVRNTQKSHDCTPENSVI